MALVQEHLLEVEEVEEGLLVRIQVVVVVVEAEEVEVEGACSA
jgi:hypothetical protein